MIASKKIYKLSALEAELGLAEPSGLATIEAIVIDWAHAPVPQQIRDDYFKRIAADHIGGRYTEAELIEDGFEIRICRSNGAVVLDTLPKNLF